MDMGRLTLFPEISGVQRPEDPLGWVWGWGRFLVVEEAALRTAIVRIFLRVLLGDPRFLLAVAQVDMGCRL